MASSSGSRPLADLGREGAHVDDHQIERLEAVLGQLGQLLRAIAAREDAGVDRGVERLDLAAEEGRDVGEGGDGRGLDAFRAQRLPGPVGGVELDAQALQLLREVDDALPVSHGEQGSHSGSSVSWAMAQPGAPRSTSRV